MDDVDALISMYLCKGNFKKHCVKLMKTVVGQARTVVALCLQNPKRLDYVTARTLRMKGLENMGCHGAVIHGDEVLPIKLYADSKEDRKWGLENERKISKFAAVQARILLGLQACTCEVVLFRSALFSGRAINWEVTKD